MNFKCYENSDFYRIFVNDKLIVIVFEEGEDTLIVTLDRLTKEKKKYDIDNHWETPEEIGGLLGSYPETEWIDMIPEEVVEIIMKYLDEIDPNDFNFEEDN